MELPKEPQPHKVIATGDPPDGTGKHAPSGLAARP